MKIINCEKDSLYTTELNVAVNRVEFVSNRMSYIVLRGRWCNVNILNVHVTSEEKTDDSKLCLRGVRTDFS